MENIAYFMTRQVVTSRLETPLAKIVETIHELKVGSVVILDEEGVPAGIITAKSIIDALHQSGGRALDRSAKEVMSAPLITLGPDDVLLLAAEIMLEKKVKRLPVVKNGKLHGLISYRDITRALLENNLRLTIASKKLEEKANKDGLTQLSTKSVVFDALKSYIEISRSTSETLAALMIDIDHFKYINDTYGHLCGDEVLKDLASILQRGTRKPNIVGRYGGEEFIVVVPQVSTEQALAFANRLHGEIAGHVFRCKDVELNLTVSIGLAMWTSSIESELELIQMADEALYLAKRTGRNRVCQFDQ